MSYLVYHDLPRPLTDVYLSFIPARYLTFIISVGITTWCPVGWQTNNLTVPDICKVRPGFAGMRGYIYAITPPGHAFLLRYIMTSAHTTPTFSGCWCQFCQMQEWMKHSPEWAQGYSDRLFGAMVEDHRARSFVLAWATCKVLEPLRLLGAIAITPRLARSLGRAPARVTDDGDDDADDDASSRAMERKKGPGTDDSDGGNGSCRNGDGRGR